VKKPLIIAAIALLGLSLIAVPSLVLGDDAAPCVGKQSLPMVKKACAAGGQKAAAKAMKNWVKRVKKARKAAGEMDFKFTCKSCHAKMKPDYPIKDSAKETFKRHQDWLGTQGSLSLPEAEQLAAVLKKNSH